MWGGELSYFGEILSACDFSQAALDAFRIIHLTDAEEPISTPAKPLSFVYLHLPQALVLSGIERQTIMSFSQISHLFDITDFEDDPLLIRVFSVDIGSGGYDRSYVQHLIHSVIAREAPYCSVAIVRSNKAIALSMAFEKANEIKTIYLSDWYELSAAAVDRFFISIETELFSLSSGVDFLTDLIHVAAREYYTHPLSYEYMRYELDTDEGFLEQIVEKYGADYVPDEYLEATNRKIDTIDDIDFDLIEYELEQIGLADLSNDDDSDEEFEQMSLSVGEQQNEQTNDIPEEVLADPVKLLKWLDEYSSDIPSEISHDARIMDLANEAGIDFIDHRSKGGRLWIFGGYELSDFVLKCEEEGYLFHFKEGGGKATDGFDAWWCI